MRKRDSGAFSRCQRSGLMLSASARDPRRGRTDARSALAEERVATDHGTDGNSRG